LIFNTTRGIYVSKLLEVEDFQHCTGGEMVMQ